MDTSNKKMLGMEAGETHGKCHGGLSFILFYVSYIFVQNIISCLINNKPNTNKFNKAYCVELYSNLACVFFVFHLFQIFKCFVNQIQFNPYCI